MCIIEECNDLLNVYEVSNQVTFQLVTASRFTEDNVIYYI